MFWALVAGITFTLLGLYVTFISLKKDDLRQGMYGHIGFYIYILVGAAIMVGVFSGLKNKSWTILIYVMLSWLLAGRLLTFLRKNRELTYLHLVGGILSMFWILTLIVIEFML